MKPLLAASCLLPLLACARASVPAQVPAPTHSLPSEDARPFAAQAPAFVADPRPREVSARALEALIDQAKATHSDALWVLRDGVPVAELELTEAGRGLIDGMSVTKSVSALALAALALEGRAMALDAPLSQWLPEWRQGKKAQITLRQLLRHRSGLQAAEDGSDLWPSHDTVQLALCAELSHEPGGHYQYSDKASNLLGEVVRRHVGEPIDAYLTRALFRPLGFGPIEWLRDPAGHPTVGSGLKLHARDLARLGELLRRGGVHQGKPMLDPATLQSLLRADGEPVEQGLFFWLVPGGFAARGYLGQTLLVLPELGLTAVRLRGWRPGAQSGADDFADFEAMARALVE